MLLALALASPAAAQLQQRPGGGPEPDERRRPTVDGPPAPELPENYLDLKRTLESGDDIFAVPDRWRLVENIGVNERWWDPYNQNTLKGDRPIFDDWFVALNLISDTVIEPRAFPLPVGIPATSDPGQLGPFGRSSQWVFNQNFITNVTFIKGNTAYKPPDYEIRITPVFNVNYVDVEEVGVLFRQTSLGTDRTDYFIGLQELFLDYHIRNVSSRYDFDSIRVGIQPMNFDFRGFLFQDNQLGIRLFGTRKNNIFQYNIAAFWRLEKDTNSGLNDVTVEPRDDFVFFANLFWQDFPVRGFISMASVTYNMNRENDKAFFDDNDFLQRPVSAGLEKFKEYDVVYLGLHGDGHIGRLNLTYSAYYAIGEERNGLFVDAPSDISAFMVALEPSIDFSWVRLRGSLMYASGDSDPFDRTSGGFSAIFENPQFAGADTSLWIRQPIPLIGGGGVALSPRNGIQADLRASKEHGQSNFVSPGLSLIGIGVDFDITPELRVSGNFNRLDFANTSSLEVLRNQGAISKGIGWDLSVSVIWRPKFIQNIVVRLSGAGLVAEEGFQQLYETEDKFFYSILGNVVLSY